MIEAVEIIAQTDAAGEVIAHAIVFVHSIDLQGVVRLTGDLEQGATFTVAGRNENAVAKCKGCGDVESIRRFPGVAPIGPAIRGRQADQRGVGEDQKLANSRNGGRDRRAVTHGIVKRFP